MIAPFTVLRTPRPLALVLACLLALATGLALLGLARQLDRPPARRSVDPPDGGDDVALVQRFYDAANAALATGDAASLAALLAPDFVQHRGGDGRADLVGEVLTLGAAFPGLRLAVVEVAATATDEVTARVRAEGASAGAFLGLPLPASLATWGPIEVWRVANGLIAERWPGEGTAIRPRLLWRAPPGLALADVRHGVTLSRVTLPPGSRHVLDGGATARVIVVEAGTVALLPGPADRLAPGAVYLSPPGATIDVRNDAVRPAAILLLQSGSVRRATDAPPGVSPDTRPTTPLPSGEPAVVRDLVFVPPGRMSVGAMVALGRLELAPGAVMPLAPTEGPVVLGVETGHLHLAAGRCAWTTGSDGRSRALSEATLGAGDHAMLAAAAPATWWVAGDAPVSVLVLAIAPSFGELTMTGLPAAVPAPCADE